MAATGRAALAGNQAAAPLPYASLQLRLVAFIMDIIVLVSFLMLFIAAGGLQAAFRSNFFDRDPPDSAFWVWAAFLGAFVVPFLPLYFSLLWSWKGQSVGQMAVLIRVARRDGGRLSFGRALFRTLLWPLSVLPLGLGLAPMFFDRENRALHDYLADTVVLELQ